MIDDAKLIEALGGVSAVARVCRVTRAAVSQWKQDGIPRARRMYLELRFPEVFAEQEAVA